VLRAFHNVCRHRAYEVTRKERGSSTILGCRYHGWSYDTKGQLTKAPEFDTIPGFDKNKNGLWEIHVKVSAQGLVFVNIDAARIIDDSMIGQLDIRTKYWNTSLSKRMAEWHYEGNFNWKLAGEYIHRLILYFEKEIIIMHLDANSLKLTRTLSMVALQMSLRISMTVVIGFRDSLAASPGRRDKRIGVLACLPQWLCIKQRQSAFLSRLCRSRPQKRLWDMSYTLAQLNFRRPWKCLYSS
jgi:nitrite reductase/ring-hydroxylating ferredoxin subunit